MKILWVVLLLVVMPACADTSESGSFQKFSCGSVTLNIPDGHVIKTSRFLWIDTAEGLDNTDCSVRLVFDEVADIYLAGLKSELILKGILSVYNSNKSGNRVSIEEQASNRAGIFKGAKYIENILPGIVAVYEEGVSSNSYVFKDHDLNVLSYIGSCSGQDYKLNHCVFVYRHDDVQIEFSLNGLEIDIEFYRAIIQLFESKVNQWSASDEL